MLHTLNLLIYINHISIELKKINIKKEYYLTPFFWIIFYAVSQFFA